MKELFIQQMDENPYMFDAEYQYWLHSQKLATQEDKISEQNESIKHVNVPIDRIL